MKNILNILAAILFVFATVISSNAQSIEMIRTDVDISRSNFVTATYLFGVDIKLNDVWNSNGVEFELAFNNTEYIKFSEWNIDWDDKNVGFGDSATTVVIPIIDNLAGQGRVYCLVISGDQVKEAEVDTPRVIHLDFAVSQAAPHGTNVTFSFINAHAIVNQDSIGEVIDLSSESTVYEIHGFIDVWPGDTDNNGYVDVVDMDMIALHFGHPYNNPKGEKKKRSFKRQNSSTLWSSQRVLAWDSAAVTNADCDGDGNVTAYDMLVIPLNFARMTNNIEKVYTPKMQSEVLSSFSHTTETSIQIPIFIDYTEPFIAATAKISWNDFLDDYKVLGFDKGNIFQGESSFLYERINWEEKSAEIVIGDFDRNSQAQLSGSLLYMVVEPFGSSKSIPTPIISELSGMSPRGYVFPMEHEVFTSVQEQTSDDTFIVKTRHSQLTIDFSKTQEDLYNIMLYNIHGKSMFANTEINTMNQKYLSLNLFELASGPYYLSIISGKHHKTFPILLVK